jgi:hypothetical protein
MMNLGVILPTQTLIVLFLQLHTWLFGVNLQLAIAPLANAFPPQAQTKAKSPQFR